MIFKGRKYNKCPKVVMLPIHDAEGKLQPYVEPGTENCCYFGQSVPQDKADTVKGSIKTGYTWGNKEENPEAPSVYAVPIKSKGFSLTNLMYGTDGYMYLAKDGRVYRAKTHA